MLMFNYLFSSETYEPVSRDTCCPRPAPAPPPLWQNLKSWIFSLL